MRRAYSPSRPALSSTMRGMHAPAHRIWRYAGLAWVVLLAGPIAHAVVRWEMGVGRDIDMSGVHELVLMFLIVLSVPMAALAFGLFAPLAVALDVVVKGRTSRVVNMMLGAALSAPALVVTAIVGGGSLNVFASVANMHRATGLLAALPLAGIIVGLGMRHRGAAPQPARPSSAG